MNKKRGRVDKIFFAVAAILLVTLACMPGTTVPESSPPDADIEQTRPTEPAALPAPGEAQPVAGINNIVSLNEVNTLLPTFSQVAWTISLGDESGEFRWQFEEYEEINGQQAARIAMNKQGQDSTVWLDENGQAIRINMLNMTFDDEEADGMYASHWIEHVFLYGPHEEEAIRVLQTGNSGWDVQVEGQGRETIAGLDVEITRIVLTFKEATVSIQYRIGVADFGEFQLIVEFFMDSEYAISGQETAEEIKLRLQVMELIRR